MVVGEWATGFEVADPSSSLHQRWPGGLVVVVLGVARLDQKAAAALGAGFGVACALECELLETLAVLSRARELRDILQRYYGVLCMRACRRVGATMGTRRLLGRPVFGLLWREGGGERGGMCCYG